MIIQALMYAKEKHEGQKRIGGKAYITHPIAVAEILEKKGFDTPYILTGLFHDLLEDTDAKEEEILFYGGEKVLTAVKRVTKIKGYQMIEYIEEIKKDIIAKMVKLADRLHNLLSATIANEKFRRRYVQETEEYYVDLAKGTPFETDIQEALIALKATLS
ncbi:hypothetical protein CVD28_24525 [Bacillus sp. M6-12]|uniref:HD domain-containing protein n=1 Tax=Bacillus sp. M6-12 TaxID=2054166 RepID=UPI000C78FBBF|nr:HD domain-containing protein [Bacillus sp. M6-12]PLS15049.1 hypothetical protein CVD28_24525 [Bacillus sp. M6-12]